MDSFASVHLSGPARWHSQSYGAQFLPFFPLPRLLWLQCVAGRTEAQDPIRSHEALQDSGKSPGSPM